MWIVLGTLVKDNWKLIAAGLVTLAIFGTVFYAGWKVGNAGKQEVVAEYAAYKAAQTKRFEGLQAGLAQDAVIANQKLRNQEHERENNEAKNRTRLASQKQKLERIQLDAAFVELLNDSRRQSAAITEEQGDGVLDAEAGGSQVAGGNAAKGIDLSRHQYTLYDLGENILINNNNHEACVEQVIAWQGFYGDLYDKFERKL